MKRIFTAFMMMLCAVCAASAANYLTFTAEEDGSTFGIVCGNKKPNLQYSLDGGETWTALADGDTVILAHKGDHALLRGDNPEGLSSSWNQCSTFTMTGKVAASGSVMSLIDGTGLSTEIPKENCFNSLFKGCASLTQAPELPATTLTENCYRAIFSGCTSLTQAPALPAMTLADRCYYDMFYGCTRLTQAPELPATTLKENCYSEMFAKCTSLTQAPELPAMTLDGGCYAAMFSDCTGLTQAPALPATTLTYMCYYGMFGGCTSLTQAPALPATTLPGYCYVRMFINCTSLEQAPELPATTLAEGCYESMFANCISLTKAPALPATQLAKTAYDGMFSGCTNLSEINVSFIGWASGSRTSGWVKNVAPTGTFICPYILALEYGESRIPEGWTVKYVGDTTSVEPNYLTFTAEEDGSSFGIVNKKNSVDMRYSLDGGETWTALEEGNTVVLAKKGDKALFKGRNGDGLGSLGDDYVHFVMTGAIAASGSVMSLIDGIGLYEGITEIECFRGLFSDCASLTQAPELPATTLANYCYFKMFSGCTSLTQAPELPATILADGCYYGMFSGCTNLTQAPALPATTVVNDCYERMFYGCTSLTQAPELPAMTLAANCYYDMFSGCTSLAQAPALPATTLDGACYYEMFFGCTSLTQAPVLPATTLFYQSYHSMFEGCASLTQAPPLSATTMNVGCCYRMFAGCTSLTQAPELPATTLERGCYEEMFSGCTSLTQAPALPATTLALGCYSEMFSGCTSLTQAPTLPATTLALACYANMFEGCTNLSEIHVSFVNWSDAEDCTSLWTQNVAPAGTFVCPKTLALEYGESRIPEGWTVKYYVEGETNYLTFTAEEDNVSVTVTEGEAGGGDIQPAPYTQRSDESVVASVGGEKRPAMRRNLPSTGVDLKYSTDGGETWTEMVPGTPVTLAKKGDKILFKGNNPSGFSTETQRIQFDIEGTASASGSVMSLIDEVGEITVIPNEYCFANLFENCAGLTEMPDLNATELKAYCYKDMFRGCTSLTSTSMLPAITLEEGSYEGMFYDCGNLSEVSVSFSDWADGTTDWLHGVAPEGRVISPANLAPTVGDDYVPDGWAIVPDSILTDVSEALAVNITVWTDELTIFVRGAEGEVSLYDMSGRIVATSNSKDEERALCVPSKGVYVVRTSGGERSVLVR